MNATLLHLAQDWLAQDPDPQTRAELADLIAAENWDELESRFGTRLQFGTAGLRGELGAGSARMNRVLVAQAAAGIANWLTINPDFPEPSVVIGYDGRHNSAVFAKDSAAIFAGAGIRTVLFDDFVPTPMLAHAVKAGDFSVGIMVTASHNPPRDNGYKVYLGGENGGGQIISPTDSEMAHSIERVAKLHVFGSILKSNAFEVGGQRWRESYLAQTSALVAPEEQTAEHPRSGEAGRAAVNTVYSAMHGVGWASTRAIFNAVDIELPQTVAEQLLPDPDFPTVSFPNPEEPGALDLSFETANRVGATLILANDPDADRLAVAVANPDALHGYRVFTGDEVGLLLGAELAERACAQGRTGALACSIVSSSALAEVAAANGLSFVQTLTGFKWISKVPNLIFGYEEALGYCVDPTHTPDKDGISAALLIADLAGRLAAKGSNLEARLTQLGERYGHFATGQVSLRFASVQQAKDIVASLRAAPPIELAGQSLVFTDLAAGSAELPATDGLKLDLADGARVIIRPSGTEPKLKCYLQTKGSTAVAAGQRLAEIRAAVQDLVA